MYKRNIIFALSLVLFLGLFFQYNRTDGFLSLMKNTNALTVMGTLKERPAISFLPKEKYLLVYDNLNVENILLKRNIERMMKYLKKELEFVKINEKIDSNLSYAGIILAVDDLEKIKDMNLLRNYVRNGGNLFFATPPLVGPTLTSISGEIGFNTMRTFENASGIKVKSNILLKGKGFELTDRAYADFFSIKGTLNEAARVHLTTLDDVPLLWEHDYGSGKYIFYNAKDMRQKRSRGIFTGMMALSKKNFIYPVIGTKIMYIDDFPSPVPEGYNETLRKEYELTTSDFFRQIWWPDMLRMAASYNFRYTGLLIEVYNDQVKAPFAPQIQDNNAGADKANLIAYGRELLKNGGEIGLHGYNHQSLVFEKYTGVDEELGYNVWPSEDDAVAALKETRRYFTHSFPDYKLKVYVPPSNIVSAQGRKVLKQVFPELNVIASLYPADENSNFTYVQEYAKNKDGIYDMPRISFGYSIEKSYQWEILSGLTSLGVFSHFVHPDNVFYEKNIAVKGWKGVFKDFESFIADIQKNYGWLRSVTASEGALHLDDYLNLDYRVVEEKDKMTIHCWGFHNDAYFILKTDNKITTITGAQAEIIDENTYLLKISSTQVDISFESGR